MIQMTKIQKELHLFLKVTTLTKTRQETSYHFLELENPANIHVIIFHTVISPYFQYDNFTKPQTYLNFYLFQRMTVDLANG